MRLLRLRKTERYEGSPEPRNRGPPGSREKLLKIEAEAKAPTKYTFTEAVERFTSERQNSGYAAKSTQRYKYSLQRLTKFLAGRSVTQLRGVTVEDLSAWKATWASSQHYFRIETPGHDISERVGGRGLEGVYARGAEQTRSISAR